MARRLVRPRDDRILAGVCAAIARHFDLSARRVRLVFLLFGLFGAGEVVYLALWILLPRE